MSEVVLITGGAKRLGRALAKDLIKQGYRVIVHYNTSEEAARALEEEYGLKTVQGNLSNPTTVSRVFDEALLIYGQVDHLINNASLFSTGTIEELTYDEYQKMMDIHVTAPLLLAQCLYRHLKEHDRQGSVINMVDTKVSAPTATRVAYYLSKSALLEQTKVLAVALGPNVRVNAISPGAVLSNGDEVYFEKMGQLLPLKRTGSAQAIVDAVLYLLSADFVSGIELPIDGGQKLL